MDKYQYFKEINKFTLSLINLHLELSKDTLSLIILHMDLHRYIILKHLTKVNFTQLGKINFINNQFKLSQFTESLKTNITNQDK